MLTQINLIDRVTFLEGVSPMKAEQLVIQEQLRVDRIASDHDAILTKWKNAKIACNFLMAKNLDRFPGISKDRLDKLKLGMPYTSLAELQLVSGLPLSQIEELIAPPQYKLQDKVTGHIKNFTPILGCYIIESDTDLEEVKQFGYKSVYEFESNSSLNLIMPTDEDQPLINTNQLKALIGQRIVPIVKDDQGLSRYFIPLGIDVWFHPGITEDVSLEILETQKIYIQRIEKTTKTAPSYYLCRCQSESGIDALTTVLNVIQKLTDQEEILFAEPEEVGLNDFGPEFFVDALINDFLDTGRDWNYSSVQLAEAHAVSKGTDNVTVFIIDSGVSLEHPDIKTALREDWQKHDLNFSIREDSIERSPAVDTVHHGTKVSSICIGQGETSDRIKGIAPNCRLIPLKIAGASSSAGYGARASAIWQAIALLRKGERGILNLSWGMSGDHIGIRSALMEANRRDMAIVTSAGNYRSTDLQQPNDIHYPSAYKNLNPEIQSLCSVAATNSSNARASYSYYGSSSVNFAAPGGEIGGAGSAIFVANLTSGYGYAAGTSFAAPHVSGSIALILSLYPDISARDAIRILEETANPVEHTRTVREEVGSGIISIAAAIRKVQSLYSHSNSERIKPGSEDTQIDSTVNDAKININIANVKELVQSLAITSWSAQKTVEHREEFGHFQTIWDLIFTGVWDFWLIKSRAGKMMAY